MSSRGKRFPKKFSPQIFTTGEIIPTNITGGTLVLLKYLKRLFGSETKFKVMHQSYRSFCSVIAEANRYTKAGCNCNGVVLSAVLTFLHVVSLADACN